MPKKTVAKSAPVEVVVPTPAPAPTPVAETVPEPVKSDDDLSQAYSGCTAKLSLMRQQMSAIILELRTLQKRSERELKAVQKAGNKRKQRHAIRAPSGFVKPTLISDELAAFLGKDKGTELARTAVSKEINAYIRAAKLQDPTNGRKINPDAKLAKLLKLAKGDELTYFNLQKYMKHHFVKTVVAPVAV